jgi:hypothetical protein
MRQPADAVRVRACARARSDGEYMAGQLAAYGYTLVDDQEQADLWLLNGCTVKNPSQDTFVNAVRAGAAAGKRVVLAGCVSQGQPNHKAFEQHSIIGVGCGGASRAGAAARRGGAAPRRRCSRSTAWWKWWRRPSRVRAAADADAAIVASCRPHVHRRRHTRVGRSLCAAPGTQADCRRCPAPAQGAQEPARGDHRHQHGVRPSRARHVERTATQRDARGAAASTSARTARRSTRAETCAATLSRTSLRAPRPFLRVSRQRRGTACCVAIM